MAAKTSPNLKLLYGRPLGDGPWDGDFNLLVRTIDALMHPLVLSLTLTTPPTSPSDGDCYIPGIGSTGAWLGKDNYLAYFLQGTWYFFQQREGIHARLHNGGEYVCDGTLWNLLSGSGNTTLLTPATGIVAKARFNFDVNGNITMIGAENISSINRTGTGAYTVNFTTPIPPNCTMNSSGRFGDYTSSANEGILVNVDRTAGAGINTAAANLIIHAAVLGGTTYDPYVGGIANGWFYVEFVDPTVPRVGKLYNAAANPSVGLKWAVFDGTSLLLKAGNGSHMLTNPSVGLYTVTWDQPFPTKNYAVDVTPTDNDSYALYSYQKGSNGANRLPGSYTFYLYSNSNGQVNSSELMIMAMGNEMSLTADPAAGINYNGSSIVQYIDFSKLTSSGFGGALVGHQAVAMNGATVNQDGATVDGISQYLRAGNSTIGLENFTFAIRFKTTAAPAVGSQYYNDPTLYGMALSGTGSDGGITIHNGKAAYWLSPQSSDINYASNITVNDGLFHTLILKQDIVNHVIEFWCDNVLLNTLSLSTSPLVGYGTFPTGGSGVVPRIPFFGGSGGIDFSSTEIQGGTYIPCTISHFCAWDIALTDLACSKLDITNPLNVVAASGLTNGLKISPTANLTNNGLYDLVKGVPQLSSLTQLNSGSLFTFSENKGIALNVNYVGGAGPSNNFGALSVPITSQIGHWVVLVLPNIDNRNYYGPIVGFYDSTTGKFKNARFINSVGFRGVTIANWTATNVQAGGTDVSAGPVLSGPTWLHWKNDGTNMSWGYSLDGANPVWLSTNSATDFLTSFDHVIFGTFANDNTSAVVGVSNTFLCFDPNAGSRTIGRSTSPVLPGIPGSAFQLAKEYTSTTVPAETDGNLIQLTDLPIELIGANGVWNPLAGSVPFTAPQIAGWSWLNQGGSVLQSMSPFHQTIVGPSGDPAGFQLRARIRSAPTQPFTLTATLVWDCYPHGQYGGACIFLYESSSGKIVRVGSEAGINSSINYIVQSDNNPSSFNAAIVTSTPIRDSDFLWLRIRNDGTNLYFYISKSGLIWQLVSTVLIATYFTTAPDMFGFGLDSENGVVTTATLVNFNVTTP